MGPDDDSDVVEIDSCNVNLCFFVDITKLDLNYHFFNLYNLSNKGHP